MTGLILVCVGSLIIGAAIAYAMWVDFRVSRFREDLFTIRDEMWDRMRERGDLDHEDHVRARAVINSTIRFAPRLTMFSMVSALGNGVQRAEKPITDPEIQEFIDRAVRRTTDLVAYQSLLGWMLIPIFWLILLTTRIMPKGRALYQANTWSARFMMSEEMIDDRFCTG